MSVERIYYDKIQKLESKLKMTEISFEQINNSRNDLIKQLAECEMLNESFKEKQEEIKKLTFHAGCIGNPNCVLCPIVKILGDKNNDSL